MTLRSKRLAAFSHDHALRAPFNGAIYEYRRELKGKLDSEALISVGWKFPPQDSLGDTELQFRMPNRIVGDPSFTNLSLAIYRELDFDYPLKLWILFELSLIT